VKILLRTIPWNLRLPDLKKSILEHHTAIIPLTQEFYEVKGAADSLDYKAICCFAAIGFFLDDDTYYVNQKTFQPASVYHFDTNGNLIERKKYFNWHYSPRNISFQQALNEFGDLFETRVEEQIKDKRVILSLSGGLDSRTLAAALNRKPGVFSYTYEFEQGLSENRYGKAIAESAGFRFTPFQIKAGYLWEKIERAAQVNQCYSDFTNPRQVAVLEDLQNHGDIFLLGHWGDVLFDDSGAPEKLTEHETKAAIKKKMIKRGGLALARSLWQAWGLSGSFDDYLEERLSTLLGQIKISNANAQIRAFKSLCWAPRWTSVGLTFFKHFKPIAVPYYSDEMCRFICTVPEEYLSGRRIQIEYIKQKSDALAKIPWQKFYPCNLYNYSQFNDIRFLPQRAWNKANRIAREKILHRKFVSRNWELQFCGAKNDLALKGYLFDESFNKVVPRILVEEVYAHFQQDPVTYSHPLSMLLTLSLFSRQQRNQRNEHR